MATAEQPNGSRGEAASAEPPAVEQVGGGGGFDVGSAPDAAEIERIAQLGQPVLRNLQITLAYCRLSRALGRPLGADNVNWCTFATWASRRAGRTIRGEELRARIADRLEHDDAYETALGRLNARLLSHHLNAVLGREHVKARILQLVSYVGDVAADGNLKVFAELAPPFSELGTLFGSQTQLDQAQLGAFVSRFRPGATAEGGQDLLRAAFTHYAEAMFELDAKAKAELILLANDQVGLHEQTRLQPNIAGALNAPVKVLGGWIARDIRAKLPWWKRPLLEPVRGRLLGPFVAVVNRIWREEATRYLMNLPLPGEVLAVGSDLPARPGQAMYPAELEDIQHQELIRLLRQHDRTWNTTAGSGAADWTSLADRMNFIVDLFRARQQDSSLYDAPFTAEQCRAIGEGRVPEGRL